MKGEKDGDMADINSDWSRAGQRLKRELKNLGFPAELGDVFIKELGTTTAITRMANYLHTAKPDNLEDMADEMLAICNDRDTWIQLKKSQEANAKITEVLNRKD